ncbi:MAG TPA: hypothetical protein VF703_00930 [Pyrinomonadaceae bacterium]
MTTTPRPAPNALIDGRRIALVIGNSAYEHHDPLKNPFNDNPPDERWGKTFTRVRTTIDVDVNTGTVSIR